MVIKAQKEQLCNSCKHLYFEYGKIWCSENKDELFELKMAELSDSIPTPDTCRKVIRGNNES